MACCPTEAVYGYDDSRFERTIDAHFHCSICFNVLKEPVMCRNNEHLFCRGCITEHLNANSHTCPECHEELTVGKLRRARVVSNILSGLKIKCDYFHRGCQEFTRLDQLHSHVETCGFAPVKCSNEGCETTVNKREMIHHENIVCEYRKGKSYNYTKIEQNVEEVKLKIDGVAADVDEVKGFIVQMFDKLRFLENTIQISSAINHASNAFLEDIFLAGGKNSDDEKLNSVERFSWKKNVWERLSSMNVSRIGATSFVYDNQVFVAGGCSSPVVEVLNLNKDPLQWDISEAVIPFSCSLLHSVVYQNRVILFCACGDTHYCAELSLTPPHTCKQLCRMPESLRGHYAVVAFEQKVLVFGGESAKGGHLLEDVFEFDLTTRKFHVMPSLPIAVKHMASVRWGDQAVLIGGFDKNKFSKKVLMYDSNTGSITELPPTLEERNGSTAVITGNTIVVMGGRGRFGRVKSVEAFTLGGYSWRYLPSQNDIRGVPTATVLPTQNVH